MDWKRHVITLRDEHDGDDHRNLVVYLDELGQLHIDGQDLGPGTAPVSDDGEYEWFQTIAAADIPRLCQLLGGYAGETILAILTRKYTGDRSYELERLLRDSDIPVNRRVWSG